MGDDGAVVDGDPEFKQYVRMGEIAFAKMRGEEAKARIAARPGDGEVDAGPVSVFLGWDAACCQWALANEYLRQLSYRF